MIRETPVTAQKYNDVLFEPYMVTYMGIWVESRNFRPKAAQQVRLFGDGSFFIFRKEHNRWI
jgi:hypothetical protein